MLLVQLPLEQPPLLLVLPLELPLQLLVVPPLVVMLVPLVEPPQDLNQPPCHNLLHKFKSMPNHKLNLWLSLKLSLRLNHK